MATLYLYKNRIAAFSEERPDSADFKKYGSRDYYLVCVDKWQDQSFRGYINEPEFKAGVPYYHKPNSIGVWTGENKPWDKETLKIPIPKEISEKMQGHLKKFYSHFKEGQKVELDYYSEGGVRVDVPAEFIRVEVSSRALGYQESLNPAYTLFQQKLKDGTIVYNAK